MQRVPIYRLVAVTMALAAVWCSRSVARLEPARSCQLPVQAFPRAIGAWRAGPDAPVPSALQAQLSAARITDRAYTRADGRTIDLTLVSSSRSSDLHNQAICFTDQGWTVKTMQSVRLSGEPATFLTAVSGGAQCDALYWLTARTTRLDPVAAALLSIRARMSGIEGHDLRAAIEGDSLLVRLVTSHETNSQQMLLQFAGQMQGALAPFRAMALRRL